MRMMKKTNSSRSFLKRTFLLIVALVSALFLSWGTIVQIEYERYNGSCHDQFKPPRFTQRQNYLPAILFQIKLLLSDEELKTYAVGTRISSEYRKSGHQLKDAYFAKSYLSPAQIDSVFSKIEQQMRHP